MSGSELMHEVLNNIINHRDLDVKVKVGDKFLDISDINFYRKEDGEKYLAIELGDD